MLADNLKVRMRMDLLEYPTDAHAPHEENGKYGCRTGVFLITNRRVRRSACAGVAYPAELCTFQAKRSVHLFLTRRRRSTSCRHMPCSQYREA